MLLPRFEVIILLLEYFMQFQHGTKCNQRMNLIQVMFWGMSQYLRNTILDSGITHFRRFGKNPKDHNDRFEESKTAFFMIFQDSLNLKYWTFERRLCSKCCWLILKHMMKPLKVNLMCKTLLDASVMGQNNLASILLKSLFWHTF